MILFLFGTLNMCPGAHIHTSTRTHSVTVQKEREREFHKSNMHMSIEEERSCSRMHTNSDVVVERFKGTNK